VTLQVLSWANNCVATDSTNGIDFKGSAALQSNTLKRKQPKGNIIDKSNNSAIGLPPQFEPTLPTVGGDEGVMKSYILPGNQTGVVRLTVEPSRLFFFFTNHHGIPDVHRVFRG
jgi:hypothetical protein